MFSKKLGSIFSGPWTVVLCPGGIVNKSLSDVTFWWEGAVVQIQQFINHVTWQTAPGAGEEACGVSMDKGFINFKFGC